MLEQVKNMALELMGKDKSGHGSDHVLKVYNLALKFADIENADKNIVSLAALLHDVDDYKLVGKENADKLLKLKSIMLTNAGALEATKRHQIMIDFLRHFFEEENAQTKWFELLVNSEIT